MTQALIANTEVLERAVTPPDKTPWDSSKSAAYLGKSISHFQQTIPCRPDFPVSAKIAGGHPNWKASEVMEWVEAHWDRQARRRRSKK